MSFRALHDCTCALYRKQTTNNYSNFIPLETLKSGVLQGSSFLYEIIPKNISIDISTQPNTRNYDI